MNQTPEQLAGDAIDRMLSAAGWQVQHKQHINLAAATGVAVREYQTERGPADYVLFVDKKPAGTIEANRAGEGVHLTVHEDCIYLVGLSRLWRRVVQSRHSPTKM